MVSPFQEGGGLGEKQEESVQPFYREIQFSHLHPSFRFLAEIPIAWEVEFVPEITAISIYDPAAAGGTSREQSQIFIRMFEAERFLTLKTVDVLSREEVAVQSHPAVRYEIEKKAGTPDFPHQPSWRSKRHKLTDVRFQDTSPSLFYVFAYTPELPTEVFEAFLASLRFHNDENSFVVPLSKFSARPVLKPFGILITKETSPIQPERFSGYHTGVDFEILPGESQQDRAVHAMCGGRLRAKEIATGYGGVASQECLLGSDSVTVIYGHLTLSSIEADVGQYLAPGDLLGRLGEQGPETDGERAHLHLGVHKGAEIVLSGYIDREEELRKWINPVSFPSLHAPRE